MADSVRLIPMMCVKCQAPVPAKPDEVAWVCEQCGQGLLLSDEKGLVAVPVQFAAGIPQGGKGRPFWVADGQARMTRQTYKGDASRDMQAFWQGPRRFFIPAFDLPLEQLAQTAVGMLVQPPDVRPGSPVGFAPVTVLPGDVQSLAEFVILSIEAGRKDDLRELSLELQLGQPSLWILP
jgi:hypothetical protein